MHERQPDVQQTMMTLPYFHYEVPVLSLRDGTPYIPLGALCRMLGVPIARYLPKWRRSLLWKSARKLPLRTPHRGIRRVWCLHFGALPLWYMTVQEHSAPPERREPLLQVCQELALVPGYLYQGMLAHYQRLRRFLFWFLSTNADAERFLLRLAGQLRSVLDEVEWEWLDEILITQGQELFAEATSLARRLLHEQATIPTIDALCLDPYQRGTETISLPLVPLVFAEQEEAFIHCLEMLTEWYQEVSQFLEERKR